MKPAAVLVRAFQIHDGVLAAALTTADARKCREMARVFEREGVRRARIEPDIENIVDLLPRLVREAAEETLARAGRVPSVGALGLERIADALVHRLVLQDFDRAVALLAHEHRDRHAPGALARDDPVGTVFDHPIDAVLALRWDPAGLLDGFERAVAQC